MVLVAVTLRITADAVLGTPLPTTETLTVEAVPRVLPVHWSVIPDTELGLVSQIRVGDIGVN